MFEKLTLWPPSVSPRHDDVLLPRQFLLRALELRSAASPRRAAARAEAGSAQQARGSGAPPTTSRRRQAADRRSLRSCALCLYLSSWRRGDEPEERESVRGTESTACCRCEGRALLLLSPWGCRGDEAAFRLPTSSQEAGNNSCRLRPSRLLARFVGAGRRRWPLKPPPPACRRRSRRGGPPPAPVARRRFSGLSAQTLATLARVIQAFVTPFVGVCRMTKISD